MRRQFEYAAAVEQHDGAEGLFASGKGEGVADISEAAGADQEEAEGPAGASASGSGIGDLACLIPLLLSVGAAVLVIV